MIEETRNSIMETITSTDESIKDINRSMMNLRMNKPNGFMTEVIRLDGFRQAMLETRKKAQRLYDSITLTVQEA